jgi:membrane protease YdiL (CAAX protease family)
MATLVTLLAGIVQSTLLLLFADLGLPSHVSTYGMAALPAYGMAFALCASRLPSPPSVSLGLVPSGVLGWFACVLLVPSILLASELDNLFRVWLPLPEVVRAADAVVGVRAAIELVLVYVALLPLASELLLRGAIQPALVRRIGAVRGIWLTAALSALVASSALMNPWAIPNALATGLVLGLLRHGSGSLLPPVVLHMAFGLAAVLGTYGAFGIPGFDDTSQPHTPLPWLAASAASTGIGVGIARAAARLRQRL